MKILLKQAIGEDLDNICKIGETVASKTFHPSDKESIKRIIDNGTFFYITSDDVKVGIISYEKRPEYYYIGDVVVLPEYQRKGIGLQAFQALIDLVGSDKKMELITHPQNSKAIGLYLKMGFKIMGWKDDYYNDGEPRITMIKDGTTK